MRTYNSSLWAYLITRGDVESHCVISAHLSLDHARKTAVKLMVADDDEWAECSTEEGESYAWERSTPSRHRGRLFGYFAIESFELQDEGEWTCTYEPADPTPRCAVRTANQYRIRVKRVGLPYKDKFRWSGRGLGNYLLLLGPEPWKAYTDKDPDERLCCDGHECGCGGATVREEAMAHRKGLPAIETIGVSCRTVTYGDWRPVSVEEDATIPAEPTP